MLVYKETKVETRIIGNETKQLIEASHLPKIIYNSLSIRQKVNKEVSTEYIYNHMKNRHLIYHPFWIAKIVAIASRSPFPPKYKPYMAFVDGVRGYSGILSKIPHMNKSYLNHDEIIIPEISSEEDVQNHIMDVQKNQINRMYFLKKPKYKTKEIMLCYLPIWKIELDSQLLPKYFHINANSGESEDYWLSQCAD